MTSNNNNNTDINNYNWSNKTILIVDDLEIIFNYYKLAMSRTGVRLFWADNGKKALKYVKNQPEINLVLMDIQMPDMNGYETGKKIKQHNPELPVIAQTAYVLDEPEQKAFENGMDGYIGKPIKLNHLLSLLAGFLND